MRRYLIYFAITFLAFVFGAVVVAVSYLNTDINNGDVQDHAASAKNWVNKAINQIESENHGFEELLNSGNGDLVTVQGFIDQKFLCHDVTYLQPDVCTTVLIGGGSEKKSLIIRLPVCGDFKKSNCIVWKPDGYCSDDKRCLNIIRIYDNDKKRTDLVENIQFERGGSGYYHKNIQLKVTGRISIAEGKYYFKDPVEKIELLPQR